MKTQNISTLLLVLCLALATTGCQKDEPVIKIKADPPVVETMTVTGNTITYGQKPTGSLKITDVYPIKEVLVEIAVNEEVVYSETFEGEGKMSFELSLEGLDIIIPFGAKAANMPGSVTVTATNTKLKKIVQSLDVTIKRPDFTALYLVLGNTEIELVKSPDPAKPYVYSAPVGPIANGATGFIYSGPGETGHKWGYSQASKICEIDATEPITFIDSEDLAGEIHEIGFDLMTFKPYPLEKIQSIGGIAFVQASSDVLKAGDVPLTTGENIKVELIDLTEVIFDPDFFTKIDDETLQYIGTSSSATLHFNTDLNFVFVESDENPITTPVDYPDNVITLGYGLGRPSYTNYPGWDFSSGISFRKITSPDDATLNVYTQTVVIDADCFFNFYSDEGWNQPAYADGGIDFLTPDFYGKKEDWGDNYAVTITDTDPAKMYVYKITLTVPETGNATFDAVKLTEAPKP